MAVKDFDPAKKYQEQEEKVFFDDGREIELLHFIYSKPNIEEIRNNPSAVLAAIDEYARTKKYLMNVGEDKGTIVASIIQKEKPQIMAELGGYVGYSTILFADAFRKAGGQQYWSLERNPEFAAVVSSLVDLAGLSDVVKVAVGPSSTSIRRLHSNGQLQHLDMLFLDHYKPAYTTDLKLSEELKLVTPGTVLVADNVVKPGNPPYLEYVRSTCAQKRAAKPQNGVSDFANHTVNQYHSREGHEKLDEALVGDPNLIYESEMIHSWEPSGVPDALEVTRCVGVEK